MKSTIFGALLCALVMLLAVSLNKSYHQLPPKELKRRAREGDGLAQLLFRSAAYGASLQVLLGAVMVLSAAGCFVLLAVAMPAVLAFLLSALLLWFAFLWLPGTRVSGASNRMAATLTPVVAKALSFLYPVFDRLSRLAGPRLHAGAHTGLYDKDDLLGLLAWQKQQPDSRIASHEVESAENALLFGDKAVRDILTPRDQLHLVNVTEVIGPLLMDDLHKSGQLRFPVYEGKRDHIVGTLHLSDLLRVRQGGTVERVVRPDVFYVHEDYLLYQVLQAFLKTKQHLFIVTNSFEEFVGVITIEDVLDQLAGQPAEVADVAYDDLHAVAASTKLPESEPQVPAEPEPEVAESEIASSEPTEVVE